MDTALTALAGGAGGDYREVACLAPWLIAYSAPQAEHVGKASLEREGWEVYYPLRKVVVPRKSRTMSSHTRHRRRARVEVVERVGPMPWLRGYLFLRRLWGDFPIDLIHELPGVCGCCRLAGKPLTIADFEIELLRLAEADGRFNQYHPAIPFAYRVGMQVDPRAGHADSPHNMWLGHMKWAQRIDSRGNPVRFASELGRVLRFIRSADPVVARS